MQVIVIIIIILTLHKILGNYLFAHILILIKENNFKLQIYLKYLLLTKERDDLFQKFNLMLEEQLKIYQLQKCKLFILRQYM